MQAPITTSVVHKMSIPGFQLAKYGNEGINIPILTLLTYNILNTESPVKYEQVLFPEANQEQFNPNHWDRNYPYRYSESLFQLEL